MTGIGWVISGIVQRPPELTIRDFVNLSSDGKCITSFKKDREGNEPKIHGCTGGGGNGGQCCTASSLEK